MNPRVATERDLDGVTSIMTAAFEDDPLWGWAFPDRADRATWWRFLISSALRYPNVWVEGDYAAASVWIPPGGNELTAEEEGRVGPLVADLAGPLADQVMELMGRFGANHPEGPPHYYLSLLGTDPDHRGRGVGMGLLAENLALIDAEGIPAYLESSNSANDPRYERLGFERIGSFTRPDDGASVSMMWRGVSGR